MYKYYRYVGYVENHAVETVLTHTNLYDDTSEYFSHYRLELVC